MTARMMFSMEARLADIIAPHEPRDPAKLAALAAAYEAGAEVPSVVVIDWEGSDHDGRQPSAISGSHRLAAMREVYDEDQPADRFGEIEVVSGEEIIDALTAIDEDSERGALAASALAELESLGNPFAGTDFGALCAALCDLGVLPEAAAAALADQRGDQ
jgi:hypothetical protein